MTVLALCPALRASSNLITSGMHAGKVAVINGMSIQTHCGNNHHLPLSPMVPINVGCLLSWIVTLPIAKEHGVDSHKTGTVQYHSVCTVCSRVYSMHLAKGSRGGKRESVSLSRTVREDECRWRLWTKMQDNYHTTTTDGEMGQPRPVHELEVENAAGGGALISLLVLVVLCGNTAGLLGCTHAKAPAPAHYASVSTGVILTTTKQKKHSHHLLKEWTVVRRCVCYWPLLTEISKRR